jgi:putative ABC transport system permease protein
MMSALRAASLRHLLRHPAQLALAFVGLTLGVGTIVAVEAATASAQRAFELSLEAVNGAATHRISDGPRGVDEQLYVRLRVSSSPAGAARPLLAPVVAGYLTVGSRVLQLVGVDPFAAAELSGGTGARGAVPGVGGANEARDWFTGTGTVVMAAELAHELGVAPGKAFDVMIGGVHHEARLLAVLSDTGPGFDSLILTDISQAQEWLGAQGRLSRIDVRADAGPAGSAALARLRAALPTGLALEGTRREARETFAMTDAFTTNLKAMSLLALLVGTLLIYGAVSFAVLQRRATIGVLRALGATRGEVLRLMLTEAAVLGVAGGACGVVLGLGIAHGLIGLVSQTINDLYFVVAVRSVSVPASTVALAFTSALATALVAALLPALEAAGSAPRLALTHSMLEQRTVYLARRLVIVSLVLALGAAATILLSSRSLLAGFAALFMLLAAAAALTPAALYTLARSLARLLAKASPAARLACADVAASLSRTGVAVAALGMALTAMLGVAIMVQSFRESLREWLSQTLRADIYVSAPGVADSLERRLDPQLVSALLAVPGVRAHSEGRRTTINSARGPVDLNAVSLAPESHPGFIFVRGDPARAWPEFARGAILITEPLAWRLALSPGDTLSLATPLGPKAFGIAGVYREYGNDRGEVLMDLAEYRRLFGDDGIAALGLYLAPDTSAARVIEALRAAALGIGRQSLLIRSNADIRRISMGIFERTFVITRVLYWLAAGVAAMGLLSALLAWELSRSRELALIRTLGLTPRSTAFLVIAQTLFMGLAALVAAVPGGLLTALTLTEVINRRAFGWHIDLHLTASQFTSALWLALAAAFAAGLYPGWRAARMPLAAGLREE